MDCRSIDYREPCASRRFDSQKCRAHNTHSNGRCYVTYSTPTDFISAGSGMQQSLTRPLLVGRSNKGRISGVLLPTPPPR